MQDWAPPVSPKSDELQSDLGEVSRSDRGGRRTIYQNVTSSYIDFASALSKMKQERCTYIGQKPTLEEIV